MKLIDGKAIAAVVRGEVKAQVASLKGGAPGLATVLVGGNPASQAYVGSKIKACEETGMKSFHIPLPETISQKDLLGEIQKLNADPKVHGILVQLPLPKSIDTEAVLRAIDPEKDVDGLHPLNLGRLMEFKTWKEMSSGVIPLSCTPHGVIQLLLRNKIPIAGKHAVVIGRSKLVGKPAAQMLLACDATVTTVHSRTPHLEQICQTADILVAAMGVPKFVTPAMVKDGAVVIDVGINRPANDPKGKLCGDVDFDAVAPKCSWITPVPGGVGPMTVAMLMVNTLSAFEQRRRS